MADEAETLSLFDILADDVVNHSACCDSARYFEWEQEIATPALAALGYSATNWRTIDGDSFGPLVRAVDLTKDGTTRVFEYG